MNYRYRRRFEIVSETHVSLGYRYSIQGNTIWTLGLAQWHQLCFEFKVAHTGKFAVRYCFVKSFLVGWRLTYPLQLQLQPEVGSAGAGESGAAHDVSDLQ